MKSIVVLNECLFSKAQKADLSKWFSDAAFYTDTTSEATAIERIGSRQIVMMDQFSFTFSERLFKRCKDLELIIINTTAYDTIDLELLRKYGVKLANVQTYATQDVSEVALAMALELNNRSRIAQMIVQGEPTHLPGYTDGQKVDDIWPGHPITPHILRRQLKNQVVGVVGLGAIGQRCAGLFQALELSVTAYNRSRKHIPGVTNLPLKRLFKESDIIVIALAYEKGRNDGLIDRELLALARPDALLISISHPNLVDIGYLVRHPWQFRGIGLDYLVTEEVRALLKARPYNLIVTPHLGSQSVEAVENMTKTMIDAARGFADRRPVHLVN